MIFTHEEKIKFLQRRGYRVLRGFKEEEEPIHGSRFTTVRKIVWMAYKYSNGIDMETAFDKEIKKKLLEE